MGPARTAPALREGRQRSQRHRDGRDGRGRRIPEGLCGSSRTRRVCTVSAPALRSDTIPLPFEVEPTAGNHLAWMNTLFGLQPAGVGAPRKAVTLIAFGFTLGQLFQGLKSQVPPRFLALGPHIPRDVGLLMIAAGVSSLALFTGQYLRAVKYLGEGSFAVVSLRPGIPLHQLSCFVAYAIMLIGAVAFASVLVSL